MGGPVTELVSSRGCVCAECVGADVVGVEGVAVGALGALVPAAGAVGAAVEAKVVRRGVVTVAAPADEDAARVLAVELATRAGVAAPRTGRACLCFFSSQRFQATSTIEALKIEEYKPDAIPISIASTKL